MRLPEIGQTITNEMAVELCHHFGLGYLVRRINENPEQYRSWEFDGCSALPDRLLGILSKSRRWKDITYECCLPHDLEYAYGDLNREAEERPRADARFCDRLKSKMKYRAIILAFLVGVRIGGAGWLNQSFSWGFARKQKR